MIDDIIKDEKDRFNAIVIHKQNVIKYGLMFCEWMVSKGDIKKARRFYVQILNHDNSKLLNITEWENLWNGEPENKFENAKKEHYRVNAHHPEFWALGKDYMTDDYIIEMVVDWYARMKENGEPSLDAWLVKAKERYKFSILIWKKIEAYSEMLTEFDRIKRNEERDE